MRNHASESAPLAEAVRAYARSLGAIDFSGCPAEFTEAFERHREAWLTSVELFEQYGELRGELHVLFDQIRESSPEARRRLENHEKAIWGTWAEVEAAAARHGVAG